MYALMAEAKEKALKAEPAPAPFNCPNCGAPKAAPVCAPKAAPVCAYCGTVHEPR